MKPLLSDENGEAIVQAAHAFAAKFEDQPATPLWIIHESRIFAAREDASVAEFTSGATPRDSSSPACHVKIEVESLGLQKLNRKIERSLCVANKPGQDRMYTIQAFFKGTSTDIRSRRAIGV